MSLEAALDEERRSVLMLLGDNNQAKPRRRMPSRSSDMARSPSPFTSPRSPVRSMQDLSDLVGDGEIPPPSTSSRSTSSSIGTRIASPQRAPIRSMLDIGPAPKKAAPPVQPVRSMLDLDSPPASAGPRASASSLTRSAQTSPTETHRQPSGGGSPGTHPRSASDQASKSPADFGPRSSASRLADPTSEYQFSGIISTQTGQSLPRPRGSASSKRSSVMADVMRGSDIQSLILPGDVRGRPAFIVGGVGVSSLRSARNGSSRSPHGRLGTGRSNSPHSSLLSGSLSSPLGASKGSGTSSLAVLDDGRVVDLNNAFRHLSDAKLVLNGPAHLAELSRKKQARQGSAGRLEKDYLGPEGEDLLEDSSEDDRTDSSGDEGEQRGRTTAPRSVDGGGTAGQTDKRGAAAGARGPETSSRKVSRSQLAAAEEERIEVSSKAQPAYRSLLDDVVLPKPASEKAKSSKHGVHPHTSFDIGPGSGFQTPMDSDAEAEYTDIRNAQKLALTMTPIQTQGDVSRSVRMIFRGEWAKIYKDALEEHRRVRKYLVATDLSEESTHALEWAIGTVLRDGDTLIAIYCVDEETGVSSEPPPAQDDQKQATVTKESAAKTASSAPTTAPAAGPTTTTATATAAATAVAAAAASSSLIAPSPAPSVHRGAGTGGSPLILASDHSSAGRAGSVSAHSPAPSSRERSRADEERERAVKDITDRVTKLLRKTRLQVRVIVEVIHCKNPKHLITEVIDLVNPTLVILGSRGRSALKGVILGSFSNYLVTKSSVPVMVARKRLRKQGKHRRPPKQVNNLNNPAARSLANAKID